MIQPIWALTGLVLPGLVAFVVAMIIARPWRKACSPLAVSRAWAVALLLALPIAFVATFGVPKKPIVAVDVLVIIALVGAALQLVDGLAFWRKAFARVSRFAISIAMVPLLMVVYFKVHWSLMESLIGFSCLIAASVGISLLMRMLANGQRAGRDLAVVLAMCFGVTGMANMMSDWENGGQLSLSVAAMIVGGGIAIWFVPCHAAAKGLCAVLIPLYLGLILIGHFYNGLIGWQAVLLAIAPLAAWTAEIPAFKNRTPHLVHAAVRLVVVAAILAAGFVPALFTFTKEINDVSPY